MPLLPLPFSATLGVLALHDSVSRLSMGVVDMNGTRLYHFRGGNDLASLADILNERERCTYPYERLYWDVMAGPYYASDLIAQCSD